jgi:transposase
VSTIEMGKPFLHAHHRFKNGKDHCYWSLVEKVPGPHGQWVQRPILYLGEINDSQKAAWIKTTEVFDADRQAFTQLALFPLQRSIPAHITDAVQVRLSEFTLQRPRQWGACWVACQLWQQLHLDAFWSEHLSASREGTDWKSILQVLTIYRLLDPGSEWRLHRQWWASTALDELLGLPWEVLDKDCLYRCLDQLLEHRDALFKHLRTRWQDLFGAKFEVLLYDLTSTYCESDPPFPEGDKRRFGYSRDKRPDCVQVIIALIVTPEGYPLAYEVLPGNTSDKTTLKAFLEKIEALYGKAQRIWVMDRGIPTEAVLEEMRRSDPPISYLVGTPKGRLSKLEQQLLELSWQEARPQVRVKLLAQDKELYVFIESQDRLKKEREIRLRKLRELIGRLKQLQQRKHKLTRDELLLAVGQAKEQAGRVFGLVEIHWPAEGPEIDARNFTFQLRRGKYRQWRRREGRYLLRTNLTTTDPKQHWEYYLQLVEIEGAFKLLKDDLEVRPLYHQKESRIEAHIFVAFLAYCLSVTLRGQLRKLAGGLTSRAVLEKFAALQMVDVHFPTTDGRELVFRRYTQPEKDQKILLAQLRWELPEQPPPRISAQGGLVEPVL